MTGKSDDERERNQHFTRRAVLLGAGQLGAFTILTGRLYQLQVMDGRRYAPLADDNRISQRGLAPQRGRILDRTGLVLAQNEESFRVSILPAPAAELRRSLSSIARIVSLTPDGVDRVIAKAKGASRSRPVVIATGLTFDQVASINLLAPQLPGVETDTDFRRVYSYGTATGHVTGYVGSVDRHAMDDDPFLKLPGVRIGKAGVEIGMDQALRGSGGSRKFEVDARGRIIRNLEETEPVAGSDVIVTIDTKLQTRVLERMSSEARAAVVALDVATGEVVVMASVPAFDPGEIANRVSEEAWRKLRTAEHNPLLNRTISGQYPPGSTFKMVTALAALEAGTVTLDERVACRGSYEFADQTYRCWKRHGHGRSDLARALRESCDVYFYELARRTGIDRIASMARRLGLGQTYASGIGLQKQGIIPDTGWKRAALGKSWLQGETILAGIGQGYVLTTPLQLAVMTARLATGRAVVPALVRRAAIEDVPGPIFPPLDIKPEWLAAVQKAMIGVVNEQGGTGGNATLSGDMAVMIAGKTGTSQVRRNAAADDTPDDRWEHRDHALFVSYFPAHSPRYAVTAVVEHGGGGGATAAPLVRDVIEMLLQDDPVARSAFVPVNPAVSQEASATSGPASEAKP